LSNGGEKVNREKKVVLAVLVTLTISLLLTTSMSVVYAKKPEAISGIFIMAGGSFDFYPAGSSDTTIVYINGVGGFSGGISGGFTSEARWVASNYAVPPGSETWINMHIVFTLPMATVTIDSETYYGSLTLLFVGKMSTGGNWVIIGGDGGLADLHGQGTFAPSETYPFIDYEGQLHFAP
jgi:hypothetical protein